MAENNEIVINIKNTIDTTQANNPNTKTSAPTKAQAIKGDSGNNAGLNVQQAVGVASKIFRASGLGDSIEIDIGSVQKLQHYGFASAKAISGISQGSYIGLVMVLVDAVCDILQEVRTTAQKEAAAQNSVDQARIQLGLMDVSNTQVHINKWNGRVSYNKMR